MKKGFLRTTRSWVGVFGLLALGVSVYLFEHYPIPHIVPSPDRPMWMEIGSSVTERLYEVSLVAGFFLMTFERRWGVFRFLSLVLLGCIYGWALLVSLIITIPDYGPTPTFLYPAFVMLAFVLPAVLYHDKPPRSKLTKSDIADANLPDSSASGELTGITYGQKRW